MAALIALVTGGISGYYGDNGLKLSIGAIVISIISIPFIYFYTYELQRFNQQENIFLEISKRILILIVIGVAGWLLIRALKMISVFKRKVVFPIDSLITRITELITALPRLVLILALGALFKPSYLSLAIIIGLTSWNDMSRLLRAGILKAKQQPYIEAAHALGYSDLRILAIHALPNAIAPLITVFVFGISAAVIVESSLTFLGIGLPVESVSWGSILARGMENIRAWWLIVFPSLALFLTLLAMNRAGDIIQKMTNPRISI
ncbi:MAG: ABC transporter permease, partial [Chitinophagaceae bacterium]|nr:ABC transporter permease [Chitinophagaceae bacterium]